MNGNGLFYFCFPADRWDLVVFLAVFVVLGMMMIWAYIKVRFVAAHSPLPPLPFFQRLCALA
jgi:hypothetical protein